MKFGIKNVISGEFLRIAPRYELPIVFDTQEKGEAYRKNMSNPGLYQIVPIT